MLPRIFFFKNGWKFFNCLNTRQYTCLFYTNTSAGLSYTAFYLLVCYVPRSVTYSLIRVFFSVHRLLSSSMSSSALMFEFCFLLLLLCLLSFCPFTSLYVISIHSFVLSYPFANSCIILPMKNWYTLFPNFIFSFPSNMHPSRSCPVLTLRVFMHLSTVKYSFVEILQCLLYEFSPTK